MTDSPWLSVRGAATYSTLSVRRVEQLVASGELASSKIDGRRVINRQDIDRLFKSRRQSGTQVGAA